MSERNAIATEDSGPSAKRERKPWSTPRLIVSELETTEAGVVALPEPSSGIFS